MTLLAPTRWHWSSLSNRTPGINESKLKRAEGGIEPLRRQSATGLKPAPHTSEGHPRNLSMLTAVVIFVTTVNTLHLWYDNPTQALYCFCRDGAVFG